MEIYEVWIVEREYEKEPVWWYPAECFFDRDHADQYRNELLHIKTRLRQLYGDTTLIEDEVSGATDTKGE